MKIRRKFDASRKQYGRFATGFVPLSGDFPSKLAYAGLAGRLNGTEAWGKAEAADWGSRSARGPSQVSYGGD
jgi:hypothetical protein